MLYKPVAGLAAHVEMSRYGALIIIHTNFSINALEP
jgi:hypothetical protein